MLHVLLKGIWRAINDDYAGIARPGMALVALLGKVEQVSGKFILHSGKWAAVVRCT
jgi:hypothetical protein